VTEYEPKVFVLPVVGQGKSEVEKNSERLFEIYIIYLFDII
jgi:hypothetical protein